MRFGVIGGDRRQAELARLLVEDGMEVCACGVEAAAELVWPFEDAVRAEVIVLPLPLCKEAGMLNWKGEPMRTAELFRYFSPEQFLLAGQIRPAQMREAAERGLRIDDYFLREELTVANAAITAEGAVQVAAERLNRTLWGSRCLVLGYGRIGKVLCHRLRGMGAVVCVTARKPEDLAWIRAYGFEALRTEKPEEYLPDCDVIFNTIPAPVLGREQLKLVKPECLCIDLASVAGIDAVAAEERGIACVWARALPGKVAPVTAAEAIRDAIYYMISPKKERLL